MKYRTRALIPDFTENQPLAAPCGRGSFEIPMNRDHTERSVGR